jgi:tRNA (guanine37-N1)-methyltransferase
VARAIAGGIVDLRVHDLRDWTTDRHRTADDRPFGGGAGMVMKPEPLFAAIEALAGDDSHVVLMTPQGQSFDQRQAQALASRPRLLFVCGHYEGVDDRVREHAVHQELSVGDYVLSGGELPAMVVIDAVVRLLPGALGSPESLVDESHAAGLLEYPQYTRPAEFRGWRVPDVLLSGDHGAVARWRREQAVRRTIERRPDLARAAGILPADNPPLLAGPATTPGTDGPTSTTAEPAP